MNERDRHLGALSVSFIRAELLPGHRGKSHDVHDLTGKVFFDYTILG
jgi:hypothetical protein